MGHYPGSVSDHRAGQRISTAIVAEDLLPADIEPTSSAHREIDGEYIDIMCHNTVRPTAYALRCDWRGDTFYFCSPICHRRFSLAPTLALSARSEIGDAVCSGDIRSMSRALFPQIGVAAAAKVFIA